jgi:uncharacterized OsmC-like protein
MNGYEVWDDDRVNGIDVDALSDVLRDIGQDPQKGLVGLRLKTVWQGCGRSESTVESHTIGGRSVPRNIVVAADEPEELLGENSTANSRELLMAALNSCLVASYVTGAAIKGIELDSIEIESEGEMDLSGFLGINRTVATGFETIRYTVHIKGDGTPQEFREIHDAVMTTSPNYFNLARPIRLEPTLVVD